MSSALTLPLTLLLICLANLLPEAHRPRDAKAMSDAILALSGEWTGSLRYRDYQSDAWVTLPVEVEAETSPDGRFLLVNTAFDEGGWTHDSMEVRGVDASTGELITVSFDRGDVETRRRAPASFEHTGESAWSATFLEQGHDDGRAAERRETLRRDGARLVQCTEVRSGGVEAAWRVRSELVLERSRARAPESLDLLGSWTVDLRPTPDAEPYTTTLHLEQGDAGFTGTYYGSPLEELRINTAWGATHAAFTTRDGGGVYHTSVRLDGDVLRGTTHSLERDFLSVWTATRDAR